MSNLKSISLSILLLILMGFIYFFWVITIVVDSDEALTKKLPPMPESKDEIIEFNQTKNK